MSDDPNSPAPASASEPPNRKRGRGRGSVGREAIIQSTRMLLREVPPSSLTRKNVAEAAQVDPALVRYYFSDLSTLLTEVLKVLVGEYRELHAALNIDPTDPRDGIAKRMYHLTTFLARETSFHELFTEQIINGKDEWALETRNAFTDSFGGSLADLVNVGREQGLFRDDFDPRLLYLAMIGSAHFLGASRSIFHRLFGDDVPPNDLAEDYARLLTRMVLSGIAKDDGRP